MCGNRVEELETRVQELEASVEGLTDELVECKVRLRELENAVDADMGFDSDITRRASEESEGEPQTETADSTKAPGVSSDDNQEEREADSESDIIVA
jgi:predicted RNase H-like nuclease (RuvC/YqgF family)